MFEQFPYADLQQLNLDWIIKIAKDFLDQYTSIQQTISQGMDDLDAKAQQLEDALDAWYNEHSEDIANQLTSALQDMAAALETNLNYFGTRAEAKMEEVLAEIPADYSALAATVETIKNYYDSMDRIPINPVWEQGSFNQSGNIESSTRIRSDFIETTRFSDMIVSVDSPYLYELDRYDANHVLIESISWNNTPRHIDLTNTAYLRFILCKSGNPEIIPSEGIHMSLSGYTPLYIWAQRVNQDFMHYGGYVTSGTMATVLTDANAAVDNTFYLIRFTDDETNILPNLPFTRTTAIVTDFLCLMSFGTPTYKYQILYDRQGDIWTRMETVFDQHWFPWYKNSSDINSSTGATIHVGVGYEYAKLTDAMKYAYENANTTVIVHPGVYDIVTEMGADYWNNFTGYADLTHALIGNNSHFIFSPDSRVECNYTGNNQAVHSLYSPFNCLYGQEGSFILEGLTLRVSGCRYAIHDDVGASVQEQTHRYINCDIANDLRCIGAGLGADMTVEMRDCVFRSTGSVGNNPVSWHNSGGGTTGKSSIVMTGCYITGNGQNTAQFLAYGSSQKQSRVIVSNNRFTAQPICTKYDADQPYMNFEMLAFNNQID